MRINKLNASFGKLENESLSFHSGLNVIYAPNESGKSTWCAFIRAMLYGVDSSERARAGHLPDKLRYAPWSGAPMEGSMELTSGRTNITITRSTKAKNAPMREFSATYTGTSVKVEGMTGTNAGEMLTGVSKDVFRRSAFIEQGTVAVSGSPELEKRINAIVSTGEEHSSYSEADERLRAWQRKRRYNRRGMLPELENHMADTKRRLEEMSGSVQDVGQLEQRLEETRARCSQLEAAVTESRKKQRKESLDKLNAGRAVLKSRSDEHDAAMEELSLRRDEMRQSRFKGRSQAEVEGEINADLEELSRLKAEGKKKVSPVLAIVLFALAIAATALYAVNDSIVFVILAVLACAAGVLLFLRFTKARKAILDAREQRIQLLKKYRASSSSDVRALIGEYRELLGKVRQAEQAEQASREAYDQARARQNQLEETALADLDFSSGNSEAARLSRELANARDSAENLSAKIASLSGRLAAMGDPLVLQSDLYCMEDEHDQLLAEYDALTLAIDTLREADNEMQSRFSPELGRVAARYMSSVTDGRYKDVLINRDFSAMARTEGDSVARESEYLSAGTLDLLYLAVRLAVCELALPEGETCPLIIDDALVNLDEGRQSQALALLQQIAKKRQVVLFTCRQIV